MYHKFLKNNFSLPAVVFFLACIAVSAAEKPNIIFIMVDDLGKEWIKCYGASGINTPNIDKMAKDGIRFDNAYSMPQCTPSRACLLSGRYPNNNGWVKHWDVPRWSLPKSEGGKGGGAHYDWKYNLSFARIMKEAGYATAAAGKWQIHDFRVHPDAMNQHGFDEYMMWTGFETGNAPPSNKRYWDPYLHNDGQSKVYKDRFSTDVFLEFIIDFLGRNKEKPNLIYFPMALTHGPLTTTPHKRNASTGSEKHIAMVEYTDMAVGTLMKALDSLGLADNTIMIFTTDNGTSGGKTGTLNGRKVKGAKGDRNEAGACQPFIAWGPGLVPKGVESDLLTDFTDMVPTFAELGGINLDTLYKYYPLDGQSIAMTLLGKQQKKEREWIMSTGGGGGSLSDSGIHGPNYDPKVLRDKQFKVWVNENRQIEQLYDLSKDPWEENNLLNAGGADVKAALDKFEKVVAALPKKDARPVYDSALFTPKPEQITDPESISLVRVSSVGVNKPGIDPLRWQDNQIHFHLPEAARVNMVLQDLSGRYVRTLMTGYLHSGPHSAEWRDDAPGQGVYLLTLEAGEMKTSLKIFLMNNK